MPIPLRCLAVFVALCAIAVPASAEAPSLSANERAAALARIEDAIRDYYVFKDRVPAIIARIEASRAAGRYDVTEPVQFAHLVSDDLKAASHDGHVYLRDDPEQFTAASQPSEDNAALDAYYRAEAVRTHSGLEQVKILPGNVRYLRITQFRWDPQFTPQAYADAARFLRDGDAMILDLRDNGGGTSDAADLFNKLFLPPDPDHPNAPGATGRDPGWIGKPIYILINAGTGSAAEAVSYNAKYEGVATIVGMTSYGAANNNRYVPIAPRFILSVSEHVPVNPITGANWEGTGVLPDIAVSSERALAAAHADALGRLADRADTTDAQRTAYNWYLVEDRAVMNPTVLTQEQLTGHAGCYGPVRLQSTSAGLRFYRDDRPKRPQGILMQPLDGSGLFAISGYIDLRLQAAGTGIELLHGSEYAHEAFARSPCPD